MSNLYDIPLHTLVGKPTTLAAFQGKALLIVNTASKCGLTGQYEGLEALYNTYKHCGFAVLGFPSNDFSGQEPGTSDEIASFCSTKYNVTFPMFEKTPVTGPAKSPLYEALVAAQPVARNTSAGFKQSLIDFGATINPEPEILWNFEKFVVDRSGHVTARFSPNTFPNDPTLIQAIEAVLPPL